MSADNPSSGSTLGWPGRIAVGVLHGDPPQVYLAESDAVLSRLLALRLVAQTAAGELESSAAGEIRTALLEERWADAVTTWMFAMEDVVDAYPDEVVVTEEMLDAERAAIEIRMSPIFRDGDEATGPTA